MPDKLEVGSEVIINGRKCIVTPWFNPKDPGRATPPSRWLRFHAPKGKVYIAGSMKSCKADRVIRRKAVVGKRAMSITQYRATLRHIRASRAAQEEIKALDEQRPISTVAGEARTMNFLKAFRKKMNLHGPKVAKRIRQLWKPGMSELELVEALKEHCLL